MSDIPIITPDTGLPPGTTSSPDILYTCLKSQQIHINTLCLMTVTNDPACYRPFCDPMEATGPNHDKNCMTKVIINVTLGSGVRCVSPDDPRIERWEQDKEKDYEYFDGECSHTYTRKRMWIAGACDCRGYQDAHPDIHRFTTKIFPKEPPYPCFQCRTLPPFWNPTADAVDDSVCLGLHKQIKEEFRDAPHKLDCCGNSGGTGSERNMIETAIQKYLGKYKEKFEIEIEDSVLEEIIEDESPLVYNTEPLVMTDNSKDRVEERKKVTNKLSHKDYRHTLRVPSKYTRSVSEEPIYKISFTRNPGGSQSEPSHFQEGWLTLEWDNKTPRYRPTVSNLIGLNINKKDVEGTDFDIGESGILVLVPVEPKQTGNRFLKLKYELVSDNTSHYHYKTTLIDGSYLHQDKERIPLLPSTDLNGNRLPNPHKYYLFRET